MKPDISVWVRRCQENQKLHHDAHSRNRKFMLNDAVFVRKCSHRHSQLSWVPSTIEVGQGPLSYLVQLTDNCLIRHHVNYVGQWFSNLPVEACSASDDFDDLQIPSTEPAADFMPHSSASVLAPHHSGRICWPPDHWSPSQGGRRYSDMTM